jgi:hypothetical protein
MGRRCCKKSKRRCSSRIRVDVRLLKPQRPKTQKRKRPKKKPRTLSNVPSKLTQFTGHELPASALAHVPSELSQFTRLTQPAAIPSEPISALTRSYSEAPTITDAWPSSDPFNVGNILHSQPSVVTTSQRHPKTKKGKKAKAKKAKKSQRRKTLP